MDEMFVFDLHGHGEGLMPAGSMLRPAGTPEDSEIGQLKACGLDACVLCAVGDPATFGIGRTNEYGAVRFQLESLQSRVGACGGIPATAPEHLPETDLYGSLPLRVVYGVEGLDFLGGNIDFIDTLYESDVRLLGLVHYTASEIGGICMDLRGDPAGKGTEGGLTDFGRSVIHRANSLRMLVDVTHANDRTILDAIEYSANPVVCSHTGPRTLCKSPRYIPDSVLRAIAESKGLIGLWPERFGNSGPAGLGEFAGMIACVAELCGVGSVAIGTDFNGVPGYASGYRGPVDIRKIAESLTACGFSREECRAIMGENARRFVARAVSGQA